MPGSVFDMRTLIALLVVAAWPVGLLFAGPVDSGGTLFPYKAIADPRERTSVKADTTRVAYWDFSAPGNPAQGDPLWNGWTSVDLTCDEPPCVGDFAAVWDALGDADPCRDNATPQMAFVDFGQIPGVGPSVNPAWDYGPSGCVTNSTFGLAGTSGHRLDNAIHSPVIEIDPGTAGHEIRFGVYRHFDLHSMGGLFYTWKVRSSLDGLEWTDWRDRRYVYYGGPDYIRTHEDVSDLVLPGARYAQISLGVTQPWLEFIKGASTPAPYFDDVSWHSYPREGPVFSYREFELAQDNSPHDPAGQPIAMNWSNLGGMDVPFDMGQDIIGRQGAGLQLGDSIVIDCRPSRPGGGLSGPPVMHYHVRTNPVFDEWRTSGTAYVGTVAGDTIRLDETSYADGRWSFTLPDLDFLYPGDLMHYYFAATETLGGEAPVTVTLPVRLDGFGVFPDDEEFSKRLWPGDFWLSCLPTVRSAEVGDIPHILVWLDMGDREGALEWDMALHNSCARLERARDYDLYITKGPTSGTGNGLGATFNMGTLNHYDHVLYGAGDLDAFTLNGVKILDAASGDWIGDGSNDIAMIKTYLLGPRNFFGSGDQLLGALEREADGGGLQLVSTYFGLDLLDEDVGSHIGGQAAPLVRGVPGQTVLYPQYTYQAVGSCPFPRRFEAVAPLTATAYRIAEYLDPTGEPGVYPDVAAMVANDFLSGARIVISPVSIGAWGYHPQSPYWVRAYVMCGIFSYFYDDPAFCDNLCPPVAVGDTPTPLSVRNRPNPFNPITRFELDLPRVGHLFLRVYDVRGQLVRVLVDEERPAGRQTVQWDGRDDRGRTLASGVYFYEARAGGEIVVDKVALVR